MPPSTPLPTYLQGLKNSKAYCKAAQLEGNSRGGDGVGVHHQADREIEGVARTTRPWWWWGWEGGFFSLFFLLLFVAAAVVVIEEASDCCCCCGGWALLPCPCHCPCLLLLCFTAAIAAIAVQFEHNGLWLLLSTRRGPPLGRRRHVVLLPVA